MVDRPSDEDGRPRRTEQRHLAEHAAVARVRLVPATDGRVGRDLSSANSGGSARSTFPSASRTTK